EKGAMMSCRNGNGYTGGLSRLDVVKMGDFQVARGGGVWVVVGGLGCLTQGGAYQQVPSAMDSSSDAKAVGLCILAVQIILGNRHP
ncbi:MAG: hypothetical protein ACYDBH_10745, partial [Acidobacteriaceae bacterium]